MRKLLFLLFTLPLAALTGCLGDNTVSYSDWRKDNTAFYAAAAEKLDDDGQPYYERLTPEWAPEMTLLVRRHRTSPADAMRPMDNSLVNVVYEGKLVDDTVFDNSFSNTDSIYQTRPLNNVAGFWATLTTMAENDSVTVIMPSTAGYGEYGNGSVPPYSTLVFDIKLKKIVAWDAPE